MSTPAPVADPALPFGDAPATLDFWWRWRAKRWRSPRPPRSFCFPPFPWRSASPNSRRPSRKPVCPPPPARGRKNRGPPLAVLQNPARGAAAALVAGTGPAHRSGQRIRTARRPGGGLSLDAILLNGPAKHHWLPALAGEGLRGLSVNFDSPRKCPPCCPSPASWTGVAACA